MKTVVWEPLKEYSDILFEIHKGIANHVPVLDVEVQASSSLGNSLQQIGVVVGATCLQQQWSSLLSSLLYQRFVQWFLQVILAVP